MPRKGEKLQASIRKAELRRNEAYRLWSNGWTIHALARHFKVDRRQIYKDLDKVREGINIDNTKIAVDRAIEADEAARFAWRRLRKRTEAGGFDSEWFRCLILARKREAELLGLDAAQQKAQQVAEQKSPSDVDESTIEALEVKTTEQAATVRGKRYMRIADNGSDSPDEPEEA